MSWVLLKYMFTCLHISVKMHTARSNLDVIAPREIYETVLEARNRMRIRVIFFNDNN